MKGAIKNSLMHLRKLNVKRGTTNISNSIKILMVIGIFFGVCTGEVLAAGYSITDLGPGAAYGINNAGRAVGLSGNDAILYSNGTITDLGPGAAYDINNAGQAVGEASLTSGSSHAALFWNGNVIDLGTLGGSQSNANSINNSGHVAGNASTAGDTTSYAALFRDGKVINLGTLGGNRSGGSSINDSGKVVGYADTASGARHAALFWKGNVIDLGTLGGTNSLAFSINNAGQSVGQATTAGGLARGPLRS